MTERRVPVHIETPLTPDTPEIPYDRSQMGPRSMILEIEFNGEEIDRLKAGTPRPVRLIQWIKQAALERADAEARRFDSDELREAD